MNAASTSTASDPRTLLHRAAVVDIAPRTLYLLVKLRQDVFSIEQGATDPDLDGRDLEETTTLLWLEQDGDPVAHVRVLAEPDGAMRIGRLAVRAQDRHGGVGGRLMRAALDLTEQLAPEQVVRIDGQVHLEQWYTAMGYRTVGPMFLEAGIEHVPMEYRHPRR